MCVCMYICGVCMGCMCVYVCGVSKADYDALPNQAREVEIGGNKSKFYVLIGKWNSECDSLAGLIWH